MWQGPKRTPSIPSPGRAARAVGNVGSQARNLASAAGSSGTRKVGSKPQAKPSGGLFGTQRVSGSGEASFIFCRWMCGAATWGSRYRCLLLISVHWDYLAAKLWGLDVPGDCCVLDGLHDAACASLIFSIFVRLLPDCHLPAGRDLVEHLYMSCPACSHLS